MTKALLGNLQSQHYPIIILKQYKDTMKKDNYRSISLMSIDAMLNKILAIWI